MDTGCQEVDTGRHSLVEVVVVSGVSLVKEGIRAKVVRWEGDRCRISL